MLDAHGALYPGAVVFFVVIETVVPERYISYTLARILDTGIGVLAALAVNFLFSGKEKPEKEEKMTM